VRNGQLHRSRASVAAAHVHWTHGARSFERRPEAARSFPSATALRYHNLTCKSVIVSLIP